MKISTADAVSDMELRQASYKDIKSIQSVADIAFRETYKSILSEEQLVYMLGMMYSTSSLQKQMQEGQEFVLLYNGDTCLGFVSSETDYDGRGTMKLHKLYILPEYKGQGLGRILVESVLDRAKALSSASVSLNMNRNNKTFDFYTHLGFELVGEEDIDIGNGYLMEDYIFRKEL